MTKNYLTYSIDNYVTDLNYRTHVMECSAVENDNIREIFKTFLRLSKINFGSNVKETSKDDSNLLKNPPSQNPHTNLNQNKFNASSGGLKRNLSAYGRLKSLPKNGNGNANAVTRKDIFEHLESGHKKLVKSGSTGKEFCTNFCFAFTFGLLALFQ